jgi:8-oxo-dGTP diphosphatase
VLRCLDTVGPFAAQRRITIESEPLLSESGFAAAPDAAVERLLAVLTDGEPVVVCSQGKSIPTLVRRVCEQLGGPVWADSVAKGAFVALHLDVERRSELVAVDYYPPPVF